jgi:hypothetical protein
MREDERLTPKVIDNYAIAVNNAEADGLEKQIIDILNVAEYIGSITNVRDYQ